MRILLTAINAKYIHSNLAVYSLAAYAKQNAGCMQKDNGQDNGCEIEIGEYTINHLQDDILQDIYKRKPAILCFSCYIWNVEYVKELVVEAHKVLPECEIWLGGPEVSYRAKEFLESYPMVRGIVKGEGEATFAELLDAVCGDSVILSNGEKDKHIDFPGQALQNIKGISYRDDKGDILENSFREPMDLDDIPFVYDDLNKFKNKIIYYESSRGCPFSCSYCLSSIDKKLRFRSVDKVKKELQFFLDAGIPQVKFVDRTFNCHHGHALEIWTYLLEHDNGITNFHFEVSADLLNEEELQILGKMRKGLVQLEIGVQSTNEQTIGEIHRTMNLQRLGQVVERIGQGNNIHQHLDLIAGLPFEDYQSFSHSFNRVYAMKPQQLQLGFLKVLSGSYMHEHQKEYGLVCKDKPPYEVLYTKWLSYEEVIRLKGVEEVVEIYYNSGQFTYTMKALENDYETPFEMYEKLADYYEKHCEKNAKHSRVHRYEILLDFIMEELQKKGKETQKEQMMQISIFRQLLTLDLYLRENMKSRPSFAPDLNCYKDNIRRLFQAEAQQPEYLSGYESYNYRQISNMAHVEVFDYDLFAQSPAKPEKKIYCLFDYKNRDVFYNQANVFVLDEEELQKILQGGKS